MIQYYALLFLETFSQRTKLFLNQSCNLKYLTISFTGIWQIKMNKTSWGLCNGARHAYDFLMLFHAEFITLELKSFKLYKNSKKFNPRLRSFLTWKNAFKKKKPQKMHFIVSKCLIYMFLTHIFSIYHDSRIICMYLSNKKCLTNARQMPGKKYHMSRVPAGMQFFLLGISNFSCIRRTN